MLVKSFIAHFACLLPTMSSTKRVSQPNTNNLRTSASLVRMTVPMYRISSFVSGVPFVALMQKPVGRKRLEHSCLKSLFPFFDLASNRVPTDNCVNAPLADTLKSFISLSLSDKSRNQFIILFQIAIWAVQ